MWQGMARSIRRHGGFRCEKGRLEAAFNMNQDYA